DALMHILRNCIDHGVESAENRAKLGKPARATITLAVTAAQGNKVEIAVSDDGGGVNVNRLKESAIRQGAVTASEVAALSDDEALSLVFHSEVSTSPIVTSISGRGLGMAIARTKVEKLGGRISIESSLNVGTTIRMVLPLTLATFRGILVSLDDR